MESHWNGCWEAHHECAIIEIGRLKAELTEVNHAADTRTPNIESKSAAQLMADAGVPNML